MHEEGILSPLHLRFTINKWGTESVYGLISNFQFNGGNFELYYCYDDEECIHALDLVKKFGKCCPMDVSVQVESGGRIVTDLSGYKYYLNMFEDWTEFFWRKQVHEIRQAIPDFRNQPLTWIIVLKAGIRKSASADVTECRERLQRQSAKTKCSNKMQRQSAETKCSIPRGFEMSCMKSLSADFAQMMARGSDHDVAFMCEGQSMCWAHGAVVCARSPVIAGMLGSDMLERRTRVITIPGIKPDIFKLFLRYLYCGSVGELTYDLALTLYELGNQYAVLGLVKRCSQFLSKHLSPENAWDVLVIADRHSDRDFVEKIIAYLVEGTDHHVGDRWSAFREKHPELALKINLQEKKQRGRKRKYSFRCLRSSY